VALPRRALRRDQGRAFVVVRRDGRLVRAWVTTGAKDDGYFEIVDGLHEGDQALVGDGPEIAEAREERR
jgi:hypothetical protein